MCKKLYNFFKLMLPKYLQTPLFHLCIERIAYVRTYMWLSSLMYIQVRPLRKGKFNGRIHGLLPVSLPGYILLFDDVACKIMCSKSSSSKTHTLNIFSHWTSVLLLLLVLVLLVLVFVVILCSLLLPLLLIPLSKCRKINFSYDQRRRSKKSYFFARRSYALYR